jgi:flagella basal body P-ring formation protein FlgA
MTAFKTVKEAVGLRLTANVGPSSILNTRNVAKAPQVLKGENVTIVAGGSGFEIIAPGKAETEGYEGDLITVRNAKTGVKLTGKLGPGAIVLVK